MAELPHLLQLQEKYGDQIVAVSWNLDHSDPDSPPPDALRDQVLTKLNALQLTCLNIVSSDPIDRVQSRYELVGLPAVLVYDREGRLANKFEGAFSYEKDVEPVVASLLHGASS